MLRRKTLHTGLCVVGGGMAGICAAIAAARNGTQVVLMHERPVLGGNASSEIRMWICGAQGGENRETGILEEIALENLWRNPTKSYPIWDTVLYEFVRHEENITLLLNCTCMDAQTQTGAFAHGRDRRITQISGYQMTTQTFFDVQADYFADCSGDSILAPLTGALHATGREAASVYGEDTHVAESDRRTMGMSCLIQGQETARPIRYTPPGFAAKLNDTHFSRRKPNIHSSSENFWYLELGGDRDSIHDSAEVTDELIALAAGTWDYIKNSGEYNAERWDLAFLGFLPGKRESRRMQGEYRMTQRDISQGRTFEDVVAFGGWPLDDHFPAGFYHPGTPNTNIPTPAPYPIPYRVLYSANVENLFFAGRNISMTHMAMSSTRVMATCALVGQAVGTAAAVAGRHTCTPHAVYLQHIGEVQSLLMDADCFLPGQIRTLSPLCTAAGVDHAPDHALRDGRDRAHTLYGTDTCGASVENEQPLAYTFDAAQHVESVHLVFDSDLARDSLPGDHCERTHSTRANVALDSPQMYMPLPLCRAFTLEAIRTDGTAYPLCTVEENRQRAWHIPLDQHILGLRLTCHSNWGGTEQTRVHSFDFR